MPFFKVFKTVRVQNLNSNCVNYIGLKSDLNLSRLGVKNPIEFMDHNKARMDGNTKQLYNVCVEM